MILNYIPLWKLTLIFPTCKKNKFVESQFSMVQIIRSQTEPSYVNKCVSLFPFTAMDLVDTTITGNVIVNCNAGFQLLSCGIDNSQTTNDDGHRYSVPLSSTACRCYDQYGARCIVWCTNAVNRFEIMTSRSTAYSSSTFSVSCSAGKKVMCFSSNVISVSFLAFNSYKLETDTPLQHLGHEAVSDAMQASSTRKSYCFPVYLQNTHILSSFILHF